MGEEKLQKCFATPVVKDCDCLSCLFDSACAWPVCKSNSSPVTSTLSLYKIYHKAFFFLITAVAKASSLTQAYILKYCYTQRHLLNKSQSIFLIASYISISRDLFSVTGENNLSLFVLNLQHRASRSSR